MIKYPGHPTSPPSWYRDDNPSPIESAFSEAAVDLADKIQREHWFGDSQKHHRFRVDFLLKDARLIIELDGHEYHSTKEQIARDIQRQRYLARAGYTVLRFTGSEIHRSADRCVAIARETYRETLQRAPAKYRVMYIDYSFLIKQTQATMRLYKEFYPEKNLCAPSLKELIPHAINWLHEKSFITVYVFAPPHLEDEIKALDSEVLEYEKGEVKFTTLASEFYSLDLGEHMQGYAHLFDEFILIADDPVYVDPLIAVLPHQLSQRSVGESTHEYLANGKLLRLCNDETSFIPGNLNRVLWQDVGYAIGSAMGLHHHEL